MTLLFGDARTALRTCRGCGCTDAKACVTAGGPCAWVLLDIGEPTGICSVCAAEFRWDPRVLATVWNLEPDEDEAAA